MLKTIVGDWGSELADGDYACALAALGVLESTGTMQHHSSADLVRSLRTEFQSGERTPVWRGAHRSRPTIDGWRVTIQRSAGELAAAWRDYRGPIWRERQRPRLAIPLEWHDRSDLFDFNDLYAWLNHADVGLDALVIADSRSSDAGGTWHWPVRVGVPAGTEQEILAALRKSQNDHLWVESLSRCYTVGGGRDSCDLLILTWPAAEKILNETRTRIRARFVVCLEERGFDFEYFGELRDRLQAVGLAAIGRPDNPYVLSDWFTAVVHDLSHDVPVHGAISVATRNVLNRRPLIVGGPRALDACRILALAERQDRIASMLVVDQESEPPPPSEGYKSFEPTFRGLPPESPAATPPPEIPESLRRGLASEFRKREFTAESVDGDRSKDELKNRDEAIERTRRARYVQANAWRPDASEQQANSLAPERWNLLAVHIGPTERERIDAVFPEGHVDFSRGDVAVNVTMELSGTELAPLQATKMEVEMLSIDSDRGRFMEWLFHRLPPNQNSEAPAESVAAATSEIKLPQAGNSSPALFAVRPQQHVKEVAGRISISHNNRVIQTASLSIKTSDTPSYGSGVSVVAEAPIHPGYDDLDERRKYDVAIQVSDIGGKLHLTIEEDGKVTIVQLDDLSSPIKLIRKALHQATVTWDDAESLLSQKTFPMNLYAIAANGSALEQHLRQKCGDRIDDWKRIHLVPATNEFLPLEYVYVGPPPQARGFKVCENMPGALERGKCEEALVTPGGTAPCPNLDKNEVVCPMHFWGFRNVIERSGKIQKAAAPGETPEKVSVPSKEPYGKLRGMLFGSSNRAFLYENDPEKRKAQRDAFVKALGEISPVSDAADWGDWYKKVVNKPNLLLLIVHSEEFMGGPALEIGDKDFLGRQEISKKLSGADGEPQLLILLGCSAASVDDDFQPYPEKFRDAGVSIVLAPVATIRGADAVPIAKRMTQIISDCINSPEPTAFGDLLPRLRRELLRAGHPGVMSIVGFGDGDWLLGGE